MSPGIGKLLAQLMLGASCTLDSPTCSYITDVLHCGVELLSCSSPGPCVGAPTILADSLPFMPDPCAVQHPPGFFSLCLLRQKQKSAKIFFADRAQPICVNSSFNTPGFPCRSVAAGEHMAVGVGGGGRSLTSILAHPNELGC